jgi:hypothetical protein
VLASLGEGEVIGHQHGCFRSDGGGEFQGLNRFELRFLPLQPRCGEHESTIRRYLPPLLGVGEGSGVALDQCFIASR